MGEGQTRYSTEVSDEYAFRYKDKIPRRPGLIYGDDKDVLFKTFVGVTYGAVTGATLAAYTITNDSPMLPTAAYKTFRYGLPPVFAGAAYGVTVGLMAKLRDKSDGWNHVAGGLVSGQILGSWFKSVAIGRGYSAIFATVGFFAKEFANNDSLITDSKFPHWPQRTYRWDSFFKRPEHPAVKDSS